MLVVKNDCPGAGSVRYVLQNGSDNERSEPITNERICRNNLSNRKIYYVADIADSNGNLDIPTAQIVQRDVESNQIVKGSDGITGKE